MMQGNLLDMCDICRKVRKFDAATALVMIGEAMQEAKNDKRMNHLSELLDEILGTEMTDQDAEVNDAWEKHHRGES